MGVSPLLRSVGAEEGEDKERGGGGGTASIECVGDVAPKGAS